MFKKNKNGFTLVELAIVIVIIGLLVGGVLQGQQLIKQAKAQANIKQMSAVEVSQETFRAKYNCLPGDCNKATTFFGTTDKNGYTVANGDNDGLVRSIYGPGAPFAGLDCLSPVHDNSSEPAQYWLHLNDAGLGNYTADGIGSVVGTGYPKMAGGNTGMIVSCLINTNTWYPTVNLNLKTGNILSIGVLWNSSRILYMTGLAQWNAAYGLDQLGASTEILSIIDRKTDDGLANSGAFGVVFGPPSGCIANGSDYPINDECRLTAGRKLN